GRFAVNRVSEQRHAEAARGVDADLVRAAGLGPELDQRAAVALGQQPPVGDRGFALARGDHPPALLRAADLAQRQLDRALGLLRDARQYAEVALADLPRLKREG